jgi:enediyne biosynthesis protein E4
MRSIQSLRRFLSCLQTRLFLAASMILLLLSSVSVAQQFHEVTTEVGLISEATLSWGNPIWADFNNDGFLDLIVPVYHPQQFVYLNNAGGTFTDIRASCGIVPPHLDRSHWRGLAFGDYDGDGNIDLYVAEFPRASASKRDLLFKGHGDGTFENVAESAGIETSTALGQSAFWFDYDNDGKLDLFVKNYASPNRLYQNNGDGTFTDVAAAADLADATFGAYNGTLCSFADYDNDGFMDVAFSGERNVLYRNNGGTFMDVTAAAGITTKRDSTGIAWGDYNSDGLLDLYIARGTLRSGSLGNTLYRNNGDGTFTNATAEADLTTTANTWAPVWGDYDNDGFLDLFVTCAGASELGLGNANLLYHNNGNGTFTDVAAAEGVQLQDNTSLHRGAAWADYDNDGFLDLVIKDGFSPGAGLLGLHRLFKNNGNSNHFIKVKLVGVQSNRDGIGASVTVKNGRRMSFRQHNGGGGGEYTSQGSEPLHFGIGTATEATVKVIWPSGIVDILSSVAANSTLTVVEGSASPLRVENINGDGESHGDVSFSFLTGDADADRTVARADKTAVQGQLNQPVTKRQLPR